MATLLWDIAGVIDATPEGGSGSWDEGGFFHFLNQANPGGGLVSFTNGDSVIFGGNLAGPLTATIFLTESLTVDTITVTDSSTYTIEDFSFDLVLPFLTIAGGIVANAGSTAIITAPLAGAGDFTTDGTVTIGTGPQAHSHSGNITVQSGSLTVNAAMANNTIVQQGGTTVTINAAINNWRYEGGTVSFGAGHSVSNFILGGSINSLAIFGGRDIDGITIDSSTGATVQVLAANSIGANGLTDTSGQNSTLTNNGTVNGAVDMGAGNDTVDSSGGVAITAEVQLGDGNDSSTNNSDVLGQAGRDTITGTATLDVLNGGKSDDTISGSSGNDTIKGGRGDDSLSGGDNDDLLYGNAGADRLEGGNGADRLFGGAGRDVSTGGAGADLFLFKEVSDLTTTRKPETITDFTQGEDRIFFAPIDANSGTIGDDAFTFVGTAAFSNTAGELRYYQTAGATFVEMDVDGDGSADGTLRLDGVINLLATDFIL